MKKIVAVGFKVEEENSIFYIKETDFLKFMEKLKRRILETHPDFVSLRMIWGKPE